MQRKVDLVAELPHYREHTLPIWNALPEMVRGRDWGVGPAGQSDNLLLIASYSDLKRNPTRKCIYTEHGAGQSYCLGPETRILTSELRWIKVNDVEIGDNLIAFDENPSARKWREWRPTVVMHKQVLNLPCYELTMSDGTILTASAEHKWLRREKETYGWLTTEELQPLDIYPKHSSKLVKPFDVWDEDTSWGGAYLAAAFDGEGCYCQTQREPRQMRGMLSFSQRDNEMLEIVKNELSARNFNFSETAGGQSHGTNNDVHSLNIKGGLKESLRFLGSVRPRRLLGSLKPFEGGQFRGGAFVEVVSKRFLGNQSVVGLTTTTGTLIAEGFATHNSGLPASVSPFYSPMGGDTRQHRNIVLFICPNAEVAERWQSIHHPVPAVVVGCPKLDPWHAGLRGKHEDRTVALTFHWEPLFEVTAVVPELRSAFSHYFRVLHEATKGWQDDGWHVIGHAHPRARAVAEFWRAECGDTVEFVHESSEVLNRATCLIADNTSLQAEFMSLGRGVVFLNHPDYRRDVEHGGRFWQWPEKSGVSINTPQILADFDLDFVPLSAWHPYGFADGNASQRAVDAILSLL